MSLFAAEARRLFARRFTWVMLLGTVAILGLIVVGVSASSQRPSAAATAQAEQEAGRHRAEIERLLRQCEQARRTGDESLFPGLPPELPCDQAFDPRQVRTEDFLPRTFGFRDEVPTLLQVLGGVVALFGFAVGASFIGAEWNTGGMMNLLLWRPRRIPVLLTKLAAVLTGVLALGAVAGGTYLAALWVAARWRGRVGSLDTEFWQQLGLVATRSLALAVATATMGFALASLGRHTATALGVGVGYLIIGEIGTPIVLSLVEVARPQRYQLSSYVVAWLNNGVTFEYYPPCGPNEICQSQMWRIELADAATVGGVILLVLGGLAIWQMARRDVT